MKNIKLLSVLSVVFFTNYQSSAQHSHLSLSDEWDECSFQLNSSLTQSSWHKFTSEAAQVSYYRPLKDAKSVGVGKLDFSLTQWKTAINEHDDAWNNTFVHPDSTHWLVDGPRLPIFGLTARTGITKKLDAGLFWTTNPKANYSILGAQLQYALLDSKEKGWAVSPRFTYTTIYGPRDLNFSSYGLDLVASKTFSYSSGKFSITPYTQASVIYAHSHEKTDAVQLQNANVFNVQAAIGMVGQISWFQIATEYNFAKASTFSTRLGVVFNLNRKKGA